MLAPPHLLLALFSAKDLDALIDAAFHMLSATVTCDFVSTFYRTGGDALLKERDSLGRESGPEFMRRYIELTPAIPIAMANRGIKIISTRTALPRSEELRKMAFYREIMQPQGWRHGVALCFWGEPPAESPIFVASVYRREGQRDFSKHDVARLESVHPFLDAGVNRLHEREAAQAVQDGVAVAVRDGGFAVLDQDFRLVQANLVARRLCAAWLAPSVATDIKGPSLAWRLPPQLLTACRELHNEWRLVVRADPDATAASRCRQLAHSSVRGLTASITMICPGTAGLSKPTFVLEFDRRVCGVSLDRQDQSAPLLQNMTESERAVAIVLADGLSNQEIAERLGKTVDAVKFLLHRIYQKTGFPSRAALVAVLRSSPNRLRQTGRGQ
jgi:DNA-binding CsgD family transcriptional regulator